MKSTKCVVCSKVKGKRICQLHSGAFICPRCCAQIRHADCEGCSYYAQAEDDALKKTPKRVLESRGEGENLGEFAEANEVSLGL